MGTISAICHTHVNNLFSKYIRNELQKRACKFLVPIPHQHANVAPVPSGAPTRLLTWFRLLLPYVIPSVISVSPVFPSPVCCPSSVCCRSSGCCPVYPGSVCFVLSVSPVLFPRPCLLSPSPPPPLFSRPHLTCMRLLPQSATRMLSYRSVVTPVGALNWPAASPLPPKLNRCFPSALNTYRTEQGAEQTVSGHADTVTAADLADCY